MPELTWSCRCGAVEARLPDKGNRIVCYCESCRGFVERLGGAERLDAAGGNELLQVASDKVVFTKGREHLRYFKMTEKGPLRWYTSCCGTPMANTLGVRWVSFASFQTAELTPAEGLPTRIDRVNLKGALARVEEPLGSVRPLITSLLTRTLTSLLTGGGKRNPFFAADGSPVGPREDPPQPTG